jgi:hypothetical protein
MFSTGFIAVSESLPGPGGTINLVHPSKPSGMWTKLDQYQPCHIQNLIRQDSNFAKGCGTQVITFSVIKELTVSTEIVATGT